jgi:hypothetical protein
LERQALETLRQLLTESAGREESVGRSNDRSAKEGEAARHQVVPDEDVSDPHPAAPRPAGK